MGAPWEAPPLSSAQPGTIIPRTSIWKSIRNRMDGLDEGVGNIQLPHDAAYKLFAPAKSREIFAFFETPLHGG